MSCKQPYCKENVYVVVLDNYGNRLCEFVNRHNICRAAFYLKLNRQYDIDVHGNFQLYFDGNRIR